MLYRLSRLIPIHFRSFYGVEIKQKEIEEGGHGNHFRSEAHYDAEVASWWQWRGRIWRHRTLRMCLP